MTLTREKWDCVILSRAEFGRWKVHFFVRSNNKKEHLDENDFRHCYGNYFRSVILKVTWFQLCSKFFLNNYEAHWQRYLKDTLQLKISRTWININTNSFLGKYHEMKMGESASENYQLDKNPSLFFEKHWTRIFYLLLYSSFPLKET